MNTRVMGRFVNIVREVLRPALGTLLLLVAGGAPAFGQSLPSGDEILLNMESALASLQDYTVQLDIVANLDRLSVPPMKVTMYHKRPDKTRFVSEGFALIPREVVGMNVAEVRRRFTVGGVTLDTLTGKRALRVELVPRSIQASTRRVILHVDPDRWTAERIAMASANGRSMAAAFQYTQVSGVWVPASAHVTVSAVSDSSDSLPQDQPPPAAGAQSMPRTGTIDIVFSSYVINSGLKDEFFESQDAERPR